MPNAISNLPPLAEYDDLKSAQKKLKRIYPTVESIRWAIRIHRDNLAACGGLIMVAGRQMIHVGLMEQVIVEAGRQVVRGARV
jgi:hypothetical protein